MSKGFRAPKISIRWSAFVAVLGILASTLVVFDIAHPAPAEAAVSSTNLMLNLDASNPSSYPGSGSTWTDLSSSARTATTGAGTIGYNSSAQMMTFPGGGNGSNYQNISGQFNDFSNGLTIDFEGNFGSANQFERLVDIAETSGDISDDFWVGRDVTNDGFVMEVFRNGTSGGYCVAANQGLATTARWTFTIQASGGCAIYKNGVSQSVYLAYGGLGYTTATYMPPLNVTRSSAYIARSHWSGDGDFEGSIRYLRIYNRGFSALDVSNNITGGINYDANGGTGLMSSQSSTTPATTYSNSFNRSGYTFTGWNTASNGSGRAFSNGASYSFTDNITLYAQWSLNAPTISTGTSITGTTKVGQTLTATAATYVSGTTPTVTSKWQRSSDNSTWSDISGATGLTYTLVDADAGAYLRFTQSVTNATGSVSSTSTATGLVLSSGNVAGISSTTSNIGSMFTVPSGSTVYNVTLVSSNLNGAFSLGTTAGLTWVEGYSTTASYMPTSITGTGSIFSFRGTGDAINTALASLTYSSSSVQTDVLKINYAVGSATATDKTNYIPIYDNGQLTYHYYSYISGTGAANQPTAATTVATKTYGGLTSPNNWYLVTPRYAVENARAIAVIPGTDPGSWTSGLSTGGAYMYYWPAGTDGFSTNVNYSSGTTAQNGMFTYWHSNQPNAATGYMGYWNGAVSIQKWATGDSGNAYATSILAETYSTSPLSATTAAQTYRSVTAASAPTLNSVTPVNKNSVTLTWTAPASSGTDAITDYVIQYSTDQSNWSTWIHSASTSSTATVTGLTAGSNYWFRVAAMTSVIGAYSPAVGNVQMDMSTTMNLTGYSIPASTAGTIRVLLWTSNPQGKLWFNSTTNIDGGIRNTANYPDSTAYNPTLGWNPATIGSAGRMVGLVDTSAADINAALASLRYSSPSTSTDTIKMWVSTGTEYIPIVSGSTVEFHYYGYTSGTLDWATARNNSNAGQARSIDGVSLTAGTPFMATPRYRAEAVYAQVLAGSNHAWYNGADYTTVEAGNAEGVWKWYGADAYGVQFSNGSTPVNGEFNNWGSGNATEPNGGTGSNCMYNYPGGYTGNTIPNSGVAWDDTSCSAQKGYVWEAYNSVAPYGLSSTTATQLVTVQAPAAAPTGLSASSTTAGQVDLTWTAPVGVSGITSYSVQYSSDGNTWSDARVTASTTTTQNITGLTNNTYYQFRVAAIVSYGIGDYASVYFTPTGATKTIAVVGASKAINNIQLDTGLGLKYVRVVLRATSNSASLKLGTYAGLTGIRGTANYTATTGNAILGTSGQMIGLVGTGAQVNTALQSLTYTGPGTPTTDSISLWVSAGSTSANSQEFVPVVNSKGQVDFHYFGYTSGSFTWQGSVNAAVSNTTFINGVAASGKYLATAESADQNALVSSAASTNPFWLNGGDNTTVNSSSAEGDWYWLGPDTGVSLFYQGGTSAGTGGIRNSSFVAWGSSSTAQGEPNGNNTENCLSYSGATYALTNSGFTPVANVGGVAWNDNSCTATQGYVWEYMSNEPVGVGTVGDNYSGMTAMAVTVSANAEAPTNVVATPSGSGTIALTWTAPTVNNTNPLTGYNVEYSTSATFASGVTTVTTGSTDSYKVISGLSAATQYYFRVTATGSSWSGTGLPSAAVSATVKAVSAPTTLTVVASGGGVSGTDYTVASGLISALTSTSVSINAADLVALLGANANVRMLADNVVIGAAVTWSANSTLLLGISTSSRVQINADVTASGSTAGLNITPPACAYSSAGTYTGCYSIDVKSGTNIVMSGSTPALTIGGTNYTVVNTVAGLTTFAATSSNFAKTWAITAPLDLSGTTYTNSLFTGTWFTGVFDGLGNSIANYTNSTGASANWEVGFFYAVDGATIRNFGMTNVSYRLNDNSTNGTYQVAGGIAGLVKGNTTFDQTWTTGSIVTATTSATTPRAIGGLLGHITGGTTTLTRSWSSVGIDASGLSAPSAQAIGGLVGTTSQTVGQASSLTGGNLTINEAYSTGSIRSTSAGWRGIGGVLGIHYDTATLSMTDVASWGTITNLADSNTGGVVGVFESGRYNMSGAYTASSECFGWAASNVSPNSVSCGAISVKPGATLTGTNATAWGSTTGSTLVNLAAPVVPLYVVPLLRTGNNLFTDGSYAAVSYKLLDGVGVDVTATMGTTGYPSITGVPAWNNISASTAVGTYSVKYVSGLSTSGTAATAYSLNPLSTSTSIQLTSTTVASSATGVSVTGSGQTTAVVGWTAPATLGTGGITSYRIWYSTSASMAGASFTDTSSSRAWGLLTGLTANTTYYVQVQAIGSAWVSNLSSSASGATKSAATTLTVVATGGGTAGTNFANTGGAFTPAGSSTSASINASDVQTSLEAGDTILAADTVTISTPISWTANTKLRLANATTSTVAINADISGTGTSAGLDISSSAYSIDTKNGANVVLSGASSTLTIGGGVYTLIRTVADLSSAISTYWYALANPITFSSTLSAAPVNLAYAGTFDGLGNTVNNMAINATTTGDYGFFKSLAGATVRNLGLTNVNISSSTGSLDLRLGALAGNGSSAGTNNVSQVWATGFIKQTSATSRVQAGGIMGGAPAGTLTITKTWSSVAVTTYSYSVGSGGIIGTNVAAWQGGIGAGSALTISESYSTGNILRDLPSTANWYGNGGIIGVAYGASTTLTNVFSWGNTNSTGTYAGTSTAGISGVGTATINTAYTTHSACGGSSVTSCTAGVTAGNAVSGLSSGLWSTTNGASLVNLTPPTKTLYVQVTAPTDGSYGTMGYQIVDSTGSVQTLSALSSMSLSVSGTPTYTITSLAAKGTYNVNYVTGLILAGTSSGVYSLSAWISTTSVTISKFNQTVTWSPTTSIPFGAGTTTPSTSASTSAGTTISYAVSNAGATGCSVDSSTGTLSYTAAGICAVTATAAAAGDYVSASTTVSFTIGAPANSITVVATGGGVSGTDFFIANGAVYGTAGSSVSVNASDISSALASGSLKLQANTVTVNAPIEWSSNSKLTLGTNTSSVVSINAGISATGTTSGLVISPASYGLSTKSGAAITLSGSNSTLVIGGNSYTLIRSTSDFANVTATSGTYWALAKPVAYTTALTASPVNLVFMGTFDGLGNTVSGLSFSGALSAGYYGLFKQSDGGTFRNLGVTAVNFNISAALTTSSLAIGTLLGAAKTSTTNLSQVWSTGVMTFGSSTDYYGLAAGGLVGLSQSGGLLSISKSWSSVALNAGGTTTSGTALGGLVGGDFDAFAQANTSAGGSITISEAYATGPISAGSWGWAGIGGLVGLHWSAAAVSITDSFSWSTVSASVTTFGGVVGQSGGSALSLSRTYTSRAYCYYTVTSYSGCTPGITPGQTSNITGSNWTSGISLSNLPAPTTPLFIKPKFSNSTGSIADLGYDLVNGSGTVTAPLNVTLDGTVTYSPASMPVSATAYSVRYDSGLSLSGTSSSLYSLSAWPAALSITISRNITSLTWSPTNAFIRTQSGVTLEAPTTDSNATPTYSISGTGNTASCSITSGRVLSFTGTGSCTVIATYAQTSTYTAASASVTITVTDAPPASPTSLSVTAGASTGQLNVSWTAPSTTSTGGTISSYNIETSLDNSTWSVVKTGVSASPTTLTGLTNGTALYVRVQAVNTAAVAGTYVTTSSAVSPYWKPINSVAPSFTGTAAGGLQLTGAVGAWSDNGNSVTSTTYQWEISSDGTNYSAIVGATNSNYTLLSSQAGSTVRLKVTKTNSAGATSAYSAVSSAITSGLASAPTLDSVTRGNQQIIVNWTAPGTLNGGTISSYTVAYSTNGTTWTSASTSVSSSATSYTITGLTNGTAYYVRVFASTAGGDGANATSVSTTTPATGPSNSAVPTISGTIAVARSLTSSNGTWADGGDSITYSYQWESSANGLSGWSNITGATASSYTPVTADAGKYLRLTVTATNTVSSASASSLSTTMVLSGLADAVSGLTTTASNSQLVLNWSAPTGLSLNGGVISDYTIEYKASASASWTSVSLGSAATTKTLTGLTNATAYDWRIIPLTAAGSGATATFTAALASTPYTTPSNSSLPTIAAPAVAVSTTSTDGTWADNGRTITGYTYQWELSSDGTTGWAAISGATSASYTPIAAQVGKYLRLQVTATNAAGSGAAYSAASSAVKTGLADAPALGSVVRADAQITVDWTAPTALNGGTISAYKVAYSTNGTTWTNSSTSVASSATSYIITGLTNGTAYYVRVIPVTAAGDGASATSVGTTTPAASPTNTVIPTINGTVAVGKGLGSGGGTWTSGGIANTYTYQWQVSTDQSTWSDISGATGSGYTPTVGMAGKYLRLNITATNAVGSITASSLTSAAIQTGLAGAPTSLMSTAGNGQIAVSWTAPTALNGGTISDYTVEYKASTDSTWTSVSVGSATASKTITGLTNGTAYDWRVTAITAAGSGVTATFSAAQSSTPYTTPSNSVLPTVPSMVGGVASTATAGTWSDNGRAISGYTYQWQKSSDATNWSDISGATSISYTPASGDAGKYFRVAVTATNVAGGSTAYSGSSTAAQSGLVSQVRNVAVTNSGSGSITVTWDAPLTTNGGTISKYWIYGAITSTYLDFSAATANGNTYTFTDTRYVNGKTYRIWVAAETAAGQSGAATFANAVPISVYGAPTVTTAGSISYSPSTQPVGGYLVYAHAPTWNSQGATITANEYQWQLSANGSTGWTNIAGATGSNYSIDPSLAGKYLRVQMSATNAGGTTTSSVTTSSAVVSGIPSAPQNLSVTRNSAGAVVATWASPSTNNGANHSGYEIWASTDGGTTWVSQGTTTLTTWTLSGVTYGTGYLVKVAATATSGLTGQSVQSSSDVTPGAVPSNTAIPTVSGTTAVARALTSTDGTWLENGYTASYSYQWQYSANGTTLWTDISGATSSSYTPVAGDVGRYLRLAVKATNTIGNTTAYSSATSVVTSGLTSAPTSVSAARADTQLDVNWTTPSSLNGGVISAYKVQYSTDNSTWTTASSAVSSSATSYSITGLTNGTNYYVRVLATTAAGDSPAGAISGTATPSTTATNTVSPVISGTVAATRTLNVTDGTWTTGGASITYSYQWQSSANSSNGWSDIGSATANSFTPDSSHVGKYLRAVISATNAAGVVTAATAATTVVQSGLADAPATIGATFSASGGLHIDVNWTSPASLNGASAVTAYTLSYATTANGSYTVVSSNIAANSTTYSVTGLTQGQSYFFRVSATTAAGSGANATTSSSTLFGGAPSISAAPAVTGTSAVGYTLSTGDGSWNNNGLTISGYTYQWQTSADNSMWTDIAGATSASYTLVSADSGTYTRSVVTATNYVGSTTAASASTLIGTGIPDASATISVTPGDNQLAVSWAAVSGSALHNAVHGAYVVEWSLDGITWSSHSVSASTTSYTISGVTNAQAYQVRVAAVAGTTNAVGAHKLATGTFTPYGSPINNTAPILSGSLARGYQLSATDGVWDSNGRSISSTTYQWQRSTDSGANWSNITSATNSQYTLTASDTGYLVRVQVTKANIAGTTTQYSTASSAIESAVAAAPTTISVTAGNEQLAVQWVAPTSLSGGTISDYLVEYSSNGGTSWNTVPRSASTATSQTITGLANGTGYLVRVSAVTSVQGTSAVASAAVVPFYTPINTALPTVTSAPRLLDTLTATVGSWNENGSSISQTDMQWEVSNDSGSTWQDIVGATSSTYVSANELGKPLRVRITQHNGGGATIVYSAPSAPIVIGTPDAPSGLSLSTGDLSLTLDWTAPTVLAGGSITDYTVQYSTNGGSSWTTVTRSASDRASQSISGLTLGQSYLVRVRTETGESSSWATATSFTAVGKPAVTTIPSIVGTTLVGQTLNVGTGSWNTNGSPLSGYTFEWQQSTDNGANWTNVLGGNSSSIPAVSGRIYRVNITATNAAGSTQTTTPVTAAVASARATPPQQLALVEQDQQITVSWATPLALGGVALANYEVDYSADGGNTWLTVPRTNNTSNSQVITGLTNNVDYDVRVRAVTTVTGQYAISTSSARPHGAPINIGSLNLVTGTSSFNQRLTANNGTWDWNGSTQNTFTYQWMHSSDGGSTWSAIAGETASTYFINGYVGEKVRVAVTATNSHNEQTTINSTATATVAPIASTAPLGVSVTPGDQGVSVNWTAPNNSGGTSISRYDVEFSTDSSMWIPVSRGNGAALTENIGSLANGVTYYVRTRAVTAVNGTWAYSAAVVPFGLPQGLSSPAVSGTLQYGQTLNASAGTWNENGNSITALSYQWQYFDGNAWQNIPSATNYGYIVGNYVGKTLRVAVTATNQAGNTTAVSSNTSSVIAAPAGQVQNLTVVQADQSLEVSWAAPSYLGGAAISDYQLEYSTDGSSWVTVAHTASSATSRTITGLSNGQSYQIRIRALNGVSGTARTDSTGYVPRGTPLVTSAPSLTGTAQVNQILQTSAGSWNQNGASVSSTAYQWQVFDGSSWANISGATASYYTVTGYVGKTIRSVVTVTNVAGQSTSQSSASATVLPAGSSAPRILRAVEEDQQVTLNWIAPATTGGADVIDYEVQSSVDGNLWTTLTRTPSTLTTHVISGLTNGDAVYFRVRALNGVNGSWAFLSQPATPRGLPINLAAPVVTGTESYGSVLSTTDGDWNSNGSAISTTTYQWQSSINGTTWSNIIGATNSRYTVGLFVGSQLRVRVTQTNAAGSTVEYSLPTAVVLSSTPAAPVITSQQAGNASIGVAWNAPEHVGGGILTGYTVEYSVDQSVWAAQNVGPTIRSVALDNLTNGATYFVRVRAETNLHGSWSGVSTPLTPRAPVVPVVVTPTASPTNFEAIRQSVMPVNLAPAATLRTSSGSAISVTQDGRIELPPTESIALINGSPVTASVVAQGEQLFVSTSAVQMQVTFDGNNAGQSNPNDQLSLAGTGFAPGTPLVTWIQSTPRKVGEGTAAMDGSAVMDFAIPGDIALGHHTLQINGVSATGEVLSVAYGIDVVARANTTEPFPTGLFVPWWVIISVLLLLIAGLVGTVRNVRRRQN
jgi:uncharacterized repeat protein (TIGR02543 family)